MILSESNTIIIIIIDLAKFPIPLSETYHSESLNLEVISMQHVSYLCNNSLCILCVHFRLPNKKFFNTILISGLGKHLIT